MPTSAEPMPLSYAVHSGSGVQLQALTAAVFLANVTERALFVPPWLKQQDVSSLMWDPKGFAVRKCKHPWIDGSKHKLNQMSEAELCRMCRKNSYANLDTFASIYDYRALVKPLSILTPSRCKLCKGRGLLCPTRIDLDPHLLHLARDDAHRLHWNWSTTGNSTEKAECGQTMEHLRPSSASCSRLLHAVSDASETLDRANRSSICVGPLNDWLFEKPHGSDSTILGRCSTSHPLARQLFRSGLPLRREVLRLVPQILPDACDVCIYARLPDNRRTIVALQDALFSLEGRTLLAALAKAWNASHLRVGGLALVNSCGSSECEHPFSVESASTQFASTSNSTKKLLRDQQDNFLASTKREQREAGRQALQRLGIGIESARILYDQLRCARCANLFGLAAGSSRSAHLRGNAGYRETSSFFKTISHLHNQLKDHGVVSENPAATSESLMKKFSSSRIRTDRTWMCDGNRCKEMTRRVDTMSQVVST